jgi:hypothetical protein
MPTREQIERAVESIKNAASSDYVVLRGTEGRPPGWSLIDPPEKLFSMLETSDKISVLTTSVDWEGFTEAQMEDVIRRVLKGEEPNMWMDDVKPGGPSHDPSREEFKRIMAEQRVDYEAARLRDSGQDYEQFLADATEQALSRMNGGGHER